MLLKDEENSNSQYGEDERDANTAIQSNIVDVTRYPWEWRIGNDCITWVDYIGRPTTIILENNYATQS